jgi:hypothetical protein
MSDRPQKITFAEMREMGVRGLLIYCADYRCSHSIAISGDGWPDDVRLSHIEPRFICQACGKRGADVRPDFNWSRQPAAMMGYRLDFSMTVWTNTSVASSSAADLAISRPIVEIDCIDGSCESWGPQTAPHPWHSRARGGAVHMHRSSSAPFDCRAECSSVARSRQVSISFGRSDPLTTAVRH